MTIYDAGKLHSDTNNVLIGGDKSKMICNIDKYLWYGIGMFI